MYGADGWVTSQHRHLAVTSPIDFAAAGMWPTGGHAGHHLWEHYLYSGDEEFLERHTLY